MTNMEEKRTYGNSLMGQIGDGMRREKGEGINENKVTNLGRFLNSQALNLYLVKRCARMGEMGIRANMPQCKGIFV